MSFTELIRSRREAAKQDQRGLTVIEMIIALVLMGLLGISLVNIFSSSIRSQADVQSAVTSNGRAQLITKSISEDVRTATAFRVTADYRIDIRTPEGTCKAYGVYSNQLYYRESTTAIPNTAVGAKRLVERVSLPTGSSRYFTSSNGGVSYSFIVGTEYEKVAQQALVIPRVTGSTTSPCW